MDAADWALGLGSDESGRVFVYSRFLMVVVFPLAAWDCFEGIPAPLQALRRPQLIRLISGMLLTTILALLIGSVGQEDATAAIAFIVWLSAAAASLGFVWIMRRLARLQKIQLTGNIATLSVFFMLAFALELLDGIGVVLAQGIKAAGPITEIVLTLAGMAITIWCIVRLRSETAIVEASGALKP
jgi:hypothetical protein